MKTFVSSLVGMLALGSIAYAGGDFGKAVEPVVTVPAAIEADDSGLYVGLGLSGVATTDGTPNIFSEKARQDRTGDVVLLAGYDFNEYIGVEGRYMTSFTQEDILERDSWGVYLKPQYPVNEKLKLYALLGYGGMTVDTISLEHIAADDEGFQWGIGANYSLADYVENLSLFVDYIRIADDMDADVFMSPWTQPLLPTEVSADALTVGVTYKF